MAARTWALASAAGVVVVLLARFAALGALGGDWAHPAFRGQPFFTQFTLALAMLPRAMAMLVLPVSPAIDYSPPLQAILHPSPALVVGGCAVVLALALGVARHRTRPQLWTLGVIVAAAAWLPSSNLLFPSGVVLSGRTLYTPSIGAALVLGWAGWWAVTRWHRTVVFALVGVLLGASAAMISRESRVWRDSDAVLRTMQARQPDDYRVPMYAGYAARDAGRLGESVARFREAIGLFPRDPEVLTDAATVALQAGDSTVAVSWFREALSVNPSAIRARTRLAGVLAARGDVAGARALLEEGLRLIPLQPTWTSLLLRLGPQRMPVSKSS